ncbi:MAG: hypothetical protein KDA48_10105, partial [Amphiplicatus sp.]|nr:hypothetical protein [Amphiplicatus sp.]
MVRNIARLRVHLRRARRKISALAHGLGPAGVWVFAVIIGAASAYGVIGFLMAIDAVAALSFGASEKTLISGAQALAPGRAWAAPVMGGLAVAV